MKIGLPRALLYYKYKYLWGEFFSAIGQDIIISPESNGKILAEGISSSIDECCLSSKIFMGHIAWLVGKCDYILVPRIDNFEKTEKVCVKFNALYDIVKNTFDVKLIDYNIDAKRGHTEQAGFIRMGKVLGCSRLESLKAYKRAKATQYFNEQNDKAEQIKLLNTDKLKILLVSHPYNTYDKFIGSPVTEYIKQSGALVIYADKLGCKASKEVSSTLYWTFNKELLGAIELYKDCVDGIIFLTAFPCGPDSLINELLLRKLKNIPVSNIIMDEAQSGSGLHTRIESFIDVILERKKQISRIKAVNNFSEKMPETPERFVNY